MQATEPMASTAEEAPDLPFPETCARWFRQYVKIALFAEAMPGRLKATLQCAGASVLLLLPILLPRHVPAVDLPSHLYNTWLVLMVKQGQPLGLVISHQWSNILFDWWLEGLWLLAGPVLAEKVAVAVCVLIFFWGAFSLVGAISGRPAWPSAPLLAMLSYGWIYHMGFFNYYLSCGFGFWALSWVWNRPGRAALAAAAWVLSVLAHALGAAVTAGIAIFVILARKAAPTARIGLTAGACALLAALAFGLRRGLPSQWDLQQALHAILATSFRPFGAKYGLLVVSITFLWAVLIEDHWEGRWKEFVREPAAGVAIIVACGLVLLPAAVIPPGLNRPLTAIDFRLAVFLTVAIQAVAAQSRRTVLLVGSQTLLAVAYFAFLAVDYRQLGATQEQFHQAVQQIPQGGRVVAAVTGNPRWINPLIHMVDKACIGRCFSYANYVPSSAGFRIRALPGSPAVMDSSTDVDALQKGRFLVRQRDVPLYGIFLASRSPFRLEVRPLKVGETVPRPSVQIPPDWF